MLLESTIQIGHRRVGPGHPAFLVAEIGANHEGDLGRAIELVGEAGRAGADAVKFQSFLATNFVTRSDPSFAELQRLEMPRDWYSRLRNACEVDMEESFNAFSKFALLLDHGQLVSSTESIL